MGKLYELLKSGEVPAPSFGLDFERMGTNKIADAMVRGKHSRNSDKWTLNRHGILVKAEEDRISLDLKDGKMGYLAEPAGENKIDPDIRNHELSRIDVTAIASEIGLPTFKLEVDAEGNATVWEDFTGTPDADASFQLWVRAGNEQTNGKTIGRIGCSDGGLNTLEFGEEGVLLTNEWQKIEDSGQLPSDGEARFLIRHNINPEIGDVIEVSGAQIEESPIPTSFMENIRGADNLIFENAEELIGQESGVILLNAAWFGNGMFGNAPNGFRIGNSLGASRGVAIGMVTNNRVMIETRSATDRENIIIVENYTFGDPIKVLFKYNFKNQDPDTTVVDGGSAWLNGIKIGDFDIRVPDVYERIAFQGATGGSAGYVEDVFFPSRYDQSYIWNSADWLTDELAEDLTDNNS